MNNKYSLESLKRTLEVLEKDEKEEILEKIEEIQKEILEKEYEIIRLRLEICKNEFYGHDFNEKDVCNKCYLKIDDLISYQTNYIYQREHPEYFNEDDE